MQTFDQPCVKARRAGPARLGTTVIQQCEAGGKFGTWAIKRCIHDFLQTNSMPPTQQQGTPATKACHAT
ncbi:hypothetical protein CAter282_3294 [Collimonas arenae]|uniref:Uncharacterized protein n=1 Tax=Collimonas arenae TaxID=279058 RepID=A0A127PTL1_9BURK|nr:hypothetical protein CAter10_3607 [Collimonas arenae]AMP10989.1 hypothetical protein CAter282_3294 [Collimonas arenae]